MRTWRLIGIASAVLALAVAGGGCGSGGSSTPSTGGTSTPTSSVRRCPRYAPTELEYGSVTAGTKGHAVPEGPTSALICRWLVNLKNRETRTEGMVPEGSLPGLVGILNSLPPPAEGDYDCEERTPLDYLIAFRYADGSQVQITVTYSGCGVTTNLNDRTYFVANAALQHSMDDALGR